MNKLFEVLGIAYMKTYGEDAQFEIGESQAFLLNDCTVVLEANEDSFKVTIAGGHPIKVDYTTGFFDISEEAEQEEA